MKKIFWILLILTTGFIIWMKYFIHPLTTSDIIQLEVAKDANIAAGLISDFQTRGLTTAFYNSIYLDYILIILYVLTIAAGCLFVATLSGNDLLRKTSRFFVVLIIVGGVFDVAENYFLLQMLRDGASANSALMSYNMAISKFTMIFICAFFILFCTIAWGYTFMYTFFRSRK